MAVLLLMLGGPAYGDSSGSYLSTPSRNALCGLSDILDVPEVHLGLISVAE